MEVSKNEKGKVGLRGVDLMISVLWPMNGQVGSLSANLEREPTEAIFVEISAIGAWNRALSVPAGYVRLRVVRDLLGVEGKRRSGSR
jgi:hypothetical protein